MQEGKKSYTEGQYEYPTFEEAKEPNYVKEEKSDSIGFGKKDSQGESSYDAFGQKKPGKKRKAKRRSKKDNVGRNFRCEFCSKMYLSYPALYTHRKLKHTDKTAKPGLTKRPMKPVKPYEPHKNPVQETFYSTDEKSGGPIDPLTHLYEVVKKDLEMEPKYYRLYNFLKVFSILDGFAREDTSTLIPKRDYDNLTESDKERTMSCDEVFSLYLREVARITNSDTYKKVMKFVVLYRECTNEFGWAKRIEFQDKHKTVDELKREQHFHEFSICNNADYLPEVANELIVEFVESRKRSLGLTRDECIDLTRNFCRWLFENGFTHSKLTIAPE